jgi:hypothetical protein
MPTLARVRPQAARPANSADPAAKLAQPGGALGGNCRVGGQPHDWKSIVIPSDCA